MSYDMNIGGRCAPGLACPAPMALPVYTPACAPKIPMPVYQPCIEPQQQFGIVGGPAMYAPPPVISYGSAYTCYNSGHQSYNQTLGTLSSIIIGAIYSTPMNGGSTPGQLALQGGSYPYAAYCPPGQNPQEQYDCNRQYQQNCGCHPQGYQPQPYPAPANAWGGPDMPRSGFGSSGSRDYGNYQPCNPCPPSAPKAYEGLWDKTNMNNRPSNGNNNPVCKPESDQWEGKATGNSGTIKINDRYTIKLDESNSSWELYDKTEKTKIKISGDPQIDTDGDGVVDASFKKDATFILEDGTKITAKIAIGSNNQPLTSELYITNGDESIIVKGLADDSKKNDGNLKVTVSHTNGKVIDKLVDDGAFTAYQVGDSWVDGATGAFLSQSSIDNAQSSYMGGENNAIVGTKGDDKLKGTSSDDTYKVTKGIDTFDGKEGTDTAEFSGDITDYKITRTADGTVVVTDSDNNVTRLNNVEKVKFGDEVYNVSGGGDTGQNSTDDEFRQLIFAMGGDDSFTLDEENPEVDYYNGGAGSDTLILTGKYEDYEFDTNAKGVTTIKDTDGNIVAVVTNVETFKFSDKTVSLDAITNSDATDNTTTTVNGTSGVDSVNAASLFDNATGAIKTVIYDGKNGNDTVELGNVNASKYTVAYDDSTGNFTLTDKAKPGVTVQLVNVETVKIGGVTYDLVDSNLSKINDLLTFTAGSATAVLLEANTTLEDLFTRLNGVDTGLYTGNGKTIDLGSAGDTNNYTATAAGNNLVITDNRTKKAITIAGVANIRYGDAASSTTQTRATNGPWTVNQLNAINLHM